MEVAAEVEAEAAGELRMAAEVVYIGSWMDKDMESGQEVDRE